MLLYREVLENGYSQLYEGWYFQNVDKNEMPVEKCKLVWEVLNMYGSLTHSFETLNDRQDITSEMVKFPGFDGNTEADCSLYSEFLIEKLKKFEWIKNLGNISYNSHMPNINKFNDMLIKFENIDILKRNRMSVEEIKNILNVS